MPQFNRIQFILLLNFSSGINLQIESRLQTFFSERKTLGIVHWMPGNWLIDTADTQYTTEGLGRELRGILGNREYLLISIPPSDTTIGIFGTVPPEFHSRLQEWKSPFLSYN